jgi:hypothetical protein
MKNKGFLLLTEQERNAKFKAALHTKTGGRLTGDEIQEILHILPADKQYEILVYHETDEFCLGVTRMKGARKRLILGTDFQGFKNQAGKLVCDMQSQAVAIAVRKKSSLEECSQLHILIPPERCRKEQGCL